MAEKYLVGLGAEDSAVEMERDDGVTRVRLGEGEPWHEVTLERAGDSGLYLLMIDNHPVELYLERRRGGAIVTIGRHTFDFDVGPWRPRAARRVDDAAQAGTARLTAPMTGTIVEVRCEVGQQVDAGQVLLVIESMKMNNELRSPITGTVEAVPALPGQRVQANVLLVALRS